MNRSEVRKIRNDAGLQAEVARAAQSGDDSARAMLVELMTPFIIRYVDSMDYNSREDREELIQEGHVATLEAIPMFDPDQGVKFTTYAYYRVRKHVSWWFAQNSGTLPMPYEAWRTAGMVDVLEDEADRSLHPDELEEATGKGYARKAADARRRHVSIDLVEAARAETGGIDEDVLEFLHELKMIPYDDRLLAALRFCDQYGLSYDVGRRMLEHADSFGPGPDHGGSVEDGGRRASEPRNRRR